MSGMGKAVQPVQPVQGSPLDSILGQFGRRKEKDSVRDEKDSSSITEAARLRTSSAPNIVPGPTTPLSAKLHGHVVALFGLVWGFYRQRLSVRLQDGRGPAGAEWRALVDTRIQFGQFGLRPSLLHSPPADTPLSLASCHHPLQN